MRRTQNHADGRDRSFVADYGDGLSRTQQLSDEAQRLTELLVAEGATFVVAFGSFARKEVSPHSDLDMLAILESDESFVARTASLYEHLTPRVALDLLVYTPSEFEAIRDRPFIQRALEEALVLPGCSLFSSSPL